MSSARHGAEPAPAHRNWIGVYPANVMPGDEDSTLWQYVDGTTTGAIGLADGTITFVGGLSVVGDWVVYLLQDDSYTVLAQAAFRVVDLATAPLVYSRHSAYRPVEPIQIGWENGPGNPLDWIGIYPEGTVPGPVPSTLWLYVDGTQTGSQGLREGMVTFPDGLGLADDYEVHLLENDGYTILASAQFTLVSPFDSLVRSDKRFYGPTEPIQITFEMGWGGVKDWVGIYPANVAPGAQPAILWLYVDGTETGISPVISGTVSFSEGVEIPGDYIAYLLADDSYIVQASERFTVRSAIASGPRILVMSPAPGISDSSPRIRFTATITNRFTRLDPASVGLALDGEAVSPQVTAVDNAFEIAFERAGLFAPESSHTFVLTYRDDAAPPQPVHPDRPVLRRPLPQHHSP